MWPEYRLAGKGSRDERRQSVCGFVHTLSGINNSFLSAVDKTALEPYPSSHRLFSPYLISTPNLPTNSRMTPSCISFASTFVNVLSKLL